MAGHGWGLDDHAVRVTLRLRHLPIELQRPGMDAVLLGGPGHMEHVALRFDLNAESVGKRGRLVTIRRGHMDDERVWIATDDARLPDELSLLAIPAHIDEAHAALADMA